MLPQYPEEALSLKSVQELPADMSGSYQLTNVEAQVLASLPVVAG